MRRQRILHTALDRVLNAIEADILHASDDEILQETKGVQREALKVRTLISRQIDLRARTVPSEPLARRRWLASFLRMRPGLTPTLSVTFSNSKKPSDTDIEEAIDRLRKRGMLK